MAGSKKKAASSDTAAKAPKTAKESAPKAPKAPKEPKAPRKKKADAEPGSRGLSAEELTAQGPPANVSALEQTIGADGGTVIGHYREPLGGRWHVVAALPIDKVQPTPFQRDLSQSHVTRLAHVIDKLDRFVDPIVAVRTDEGIYWTPNGHHRLAAMRRLGAKAIMALVLPDADVAYRILALNTEKSHNLREKALEVIRMARSLADIAPRAEREFELEFEEPALVTLGICYEQRPRFSGSGFQPVLRRIDAFLDDALSSAIAVREKRAARILEIDDVVTEIVKGLKARGMESPYLKSFVLSRINPVRFAKGDKPMTATFDETLGKMLASAKAFDMDAVRADQLAGAGGAPEASDD